jgi:hypothetical protein
MGMMLRIRVLNAAKCYFEIGSAGLLHPLNTIHIGLKRGLQPLNAVLK